MAIEMNHLASGMNTGIGAASGKAAALGLKFPWERIKVIDCLLKAGLHGGFAILPLPATKRAAVVLHTKGNALAQTSSIMAITALSPRRGTVRIMRV